MTCIHDSLSAETLTSDVIEHLEGQGHAIRIPFGGFLRKPKQISFQNLIDLRSVSNISVGHFWNVAGRPAFISFQLGRVYAFPTKCAWKRRCSLNRPKVMIAWQTTSAVSREPAISLKVLSEIVEISQLDSARLELLNHHAYGWRMYASMLIRKMIL